MIQPPSNSSLSANDIHAHNVVAGMQVIHNYYANGGAQADQVLLAQQIADYLKWVQARYGRIELRGIERAGKQVLELELDDAYVPLEATVSAPAEERADLVGLIDKLSTTFATRTTQRLLQENEQLVRFNVALDEMLALGNRLIISGGSGCGKTTVLLHIAWALARTIREGSDLAKDKLGLEKPLPLPIFVPLAAYARYRRDLSPGTEQTRYTLRHYLSQHLIRREAKLPDDFFDRVLVDGREVILLLDGLDEVADEDERARVREAVDDLAAGRDGLRIVVTCRTAAYRGRSALGGGFRELTVQPLDDTHIQQLVRGAYTCVYPADESMCREKADELLAGIAQLEADRKGISPSAEPLVTTPLMVRLLLIVHYNDRRMPEQRAELYMKATDALIQSDYGRDESVSQELSRFVGGNWKMYRDMVQHLAFHMHSKGETHGREIDADDLKAILKREPSFAAHIVDFIRLIHERGGLLEERLGMYRFIHLGFQEFLTARSVKEVTGADGIEAIVRFFEGDERLHQSWWREVILLTLSYSVATSAPTAFKLLRRLSRLDDRISQNDSYTPTSLLAATELAATVIQELAASGDALRAEIRRRILEFYGGGGFISMCSPSLRIRVGDVLAALGDLRFDPNRFYLPNEDLLGFIEIPAGQFYIGISRRDFESFTRQWDLREDSSTNLANEINDEPLMLNTYYIARYPTTVAQFRTFVKATNYQTKDKDWSTDPDSRPVRFVTWHDALAYCAWLNEQFKTLPSSDVFKIPDLIRTGHWSIALPSEAEWERVAKGNSNQTSDLNRICTRDNTLIEVGTTITVGSFPESVSSCGCHDLVGNVRQWTRSKFGPYPYDVNDGRESLEVSETRVLRGGSFADDEQGSYCTKRLPYNPDDNGNFIGFRVVVTQFRASLVFSRAWDDISPSDRFNEAIEQLKSTDPGEQSRAIKSLIGMVDAGEQPWSCLLHTATHPYWRIRLDAITFIIKRNPPDALELLHAFRYTSYHISQQRIRDYLEARFDNGYLDLAQLAMAKDIIDGLIRSPKVSEISLRKNKKLLDRLNGKEAVRLAGNRLTTDDIHATNVVVGTQFIIHAASQVFDPVWFTPQPFKLVSPRNYVIGVLVVDGAKATFTSPNLMLVMTRIIAATLIKFGGDLAPAWVKVDYLSGDVPEMQSGYFADGSKGGMVTLLGGSGEILEALINCKTKG